MRIVPGLRRGAIAVGAAAALVATSGISLAPAAPANEQSTPVDERLAVVGQATLPLSKRDAVLVADLDGADLAEPLAALLGDEAAALDVSTLIAPDDAAPDDAAPDDAAPDDAAADGAAADDAAPDGAAPDDAAPDDAADVDRDVVLEAIIAAVRGADAVILVDRDRDEAGQDGVVTGESEDEPADDGPHLTDSGSQLADDDAAGPRREDVCRDRAATWLVALSKSVVVVTDDVEGEPVPAGDDEPSDEPSDEPGDEPGDATSSPEARSLDDEADEGPDVVYVLDTAVDDVALAAVLTGKIRATGALPEVSDPEVSDRARGADGDDAEAQVDCPELPELQSDSPEPAPSDPAPSDPAPSPEPAPEAPDETPVPDESSNPTPTPEPTPDAPDADEPDAEGPDTEGPDVPEFPGPRAPGEPAPDLRTPYLLDRPDPSDREPWSLPARKPSGNPLALSVGPGGLDLSNVTIDGDRIMLSGELPGITVVDHRKRADRGWTLSAQVSDLEGPAVLPASQLGWTPRVYGKRAVAGPAVVPALSGGAGLTGAAVLGTAPRGTAGAPVELDAAVVLETTRDAAPGAYAGVITLTLFPSE